MQRKRVLGQTTTEPAMKIKTSIHWPNGKITSRVINYNNRDHKAQFAAMAVEAWKKGAEVITRLATKAEVKIEVKK